MLSRTLYSANIPRAVMAGTATFEEIKRSLLLKLADAENLRKTRAVILENISKDVNIKFSKRLLEVSNHLITLTRESLPVENVHNKALVDGVRMTSTAMKNTLEKHGIQVSSSSRHEPQL